MISTLPGPFDYRVQGLPRLWSFGSWRLASMPTYVLGCGCAVVSGPETNRVLKVETNEETENHTGQPCKSVRYSSNLPDLPTRADGGELHFGAALIHPLGVSMYSVRRVPAWPSTYSFPQGEMLENFFFLPFDRFVFALYRFARSHTPWCGLLLPPFTVSHDLTHLGRKVREHIPLKKISHALDTRTR